MWNPQAALDPTPQQRPIVRPAGLRQDHGHTWLSIDCLRQGSRFHGGPQPSAAVVHVPMGEGRRLLLR